MGLIDFLEAPLGGCKGAPQKIRRLLGGLLGAKYSSRSPLWPTPGITKMKITKKRHFFKNRWNAYFYNDSSAYGKTTAAPKRSFGLSRAPPGPPLGRNPVPWDPPGASRGRTISSRDPPWAPPRPTLAPPRPPQIAPGGPRSAQGPHQIHKVNMLKTLEIHTFALLGSQKNGLGRFFGPPRPPQRPSRVGPLIVRGAPGCPEGRLGAPRDPPRTPKDPPGSSQGPPRDPHGPPKAKGVPPWR